MWLNTKPTPPLLPQAKAKSAAGEAAESDFAPKPLFAGRFRAKAWSRVAGLDAGQDAERDAGQDAGWRRARRPVPARALALLLFALPLLAACAGKGTSQSITLDDEGAVTGFIGGVVSDEPEAALVGRDLLSAGGTAADAAAGMYFALSVTYPSAASLGGGGVCVVYAPAEKSASVLDFRARDPAAPGPVAVPANVRGFAALQARYGRLRWARILAPAEKLARLGFPLSHATAETMAALGPQAGERIPGFLRDAAGRPLAEGATVRELDLGATLARLRTAGIADLYSGDLARRFLAAQGEAGGTLVMADLLRGAAQWHQPAVLSFAHLSLMIPPDGSGSRIFTRLWQATVAPPGSLGLGGGTFQDTKLPAALASAYAGAGGNLPVGGNGSTGFVAMDSYGEAVACTVSMGKAFGVGKVAADTGILLAQAPGAPGDESRYLAPLVVAALTTHQAVAAIAATGGAVVPAVEVQVLAAALAGNQTAAAAEVAPRLFRAGPQAVVLHEPGLSNAMRAAITASGATAAPVSDLGRVSLGLCPKGLEHGPESCRFRADPRGFGLAVGAGL